MTQLPEKSVPPAGVSGNSATIAWSGRKDPDAPADPVSDQVAGSVNAALDEIDQLIGRINSPASAAVTAPFAAPYSSGVTAPVVAPVLPEEPAVRKSGPHDDEALQDYMNQFLERVTGKKKESEEKKAASSAMPCADIASPEPEKPREIKRAPESVQDMSAMRELANESARRALGVHAGQRLISSTRYSFLGALSLSLISSLLAITSLMGQMSWAWNFGGLVMLLALVLTGRFLLLRGQLQKLNGSSAAPFTA